MVVADEEDEEDVEEDEVPPDSETQLQLTATDPRASWQSNLNDPSTQPFSHALRSAAQNGVSSSACETSATTAPARRPRRARPRTNFRNCMMTFVTPLYGTVKGIL